MGLIDLQPGSGLIEPGWTLDTSMRQSHSIPDINSKPQVLDSHVTQTRQTSGGTVATYYKVTQDGVHAFDPQEIPKWYTKSMWASAESKIFRAVHKDAEIAA